VRLGKTANSEHTARFCKQWLREFLSERLHLNADEDVTDDGFCVSGNRRWEAA
jgi:hypothetical protein